MERAPGEAELPSCRAVMQSHSVTTGHTRSHRDAQGHTGRQRNRDIETEGCPRCVEMLSVQGVAPGVNDQQGSMGSVVSQYYVRLVSEVCSSLLTRC